MNDYYCEVCLNEVPNGAPCPEHPNAVRTRRWCDVRPRLDLERDPAWIFQRNDGTPERPIEVSVCLHGGRAYRRKVCLGWGTGIAWYATAPRLDSPDEEWMPCSRDGGP